MRDTQLLQTTRDLRAVHHSVPLGRMLDLSLSRLRSQLLRRHLLDLHHRHPFLKAGSPTWILALDNTTTSIYPVNPHNGSFPKDPRHSTSTHLSLPRAASAFTILSRLLAFLRLVASLWLLQAFNRQRQAIQTVSCHRRQRWEASLALLQVQA